MEKGTGICPGCRKRCDLATPRCHVGEAYARTGMLPGGKKKKDGKDRPRDDFVNHAGHEGERLRDAVPGDGRLADTLRAVSRALRHGEGTLDALSAEEKAQLGALIEKAWAGMESSLGADDRHHHERHGHHGHDDHHGDHEHHGHHDHREHGGQVQCGCAGKHDGGKGHKH